MLKSIEAQSIYIPDHIYTALKTKLTQMVAEPFDRAGTDPETVVVSAVGEIGNIWPEFVLDDVENC